jgi:hypothetical protein
MDGRNVLSFVLAGLLAGAGAASAATPCVAELAAPDAPIVTRRDVPGKVTIELVEQGVSIRKTFDGLSVVTTLAAGKEQVVITLTADAVAIAANGKRWRAPLAELHSLEAAGDALRSSKVVNAAQRLLERTVLRPNSIEGNAMLLTRAFLGTILGDASPTQEYQRWATASRDSRVVRAQHEHGPGECWDLYSIEAVRIATNYVDCGSTCHWKGWWCLASCGLIYNIRAEGAFMWFMKCNGGFFLHG